MEILKNVLLVIHVIVAIILTVIVLMQSGKSAGLSGTIAGGAETFFGKSKGRTIDAILGKWTVVAAVVFLATSIGLTVTINQISKKQQADLAAAIQSAQQQTDAADAEAAVTDEADAANAEGADAEAVTDGEAADADNGNAEANDAVPAE